MKQYMTDGQFEEYCRRTAEQTVTTLELLAPRLLEGILGRFHACEDCGAVMADPIKHKEWHTGIERSFRSAFDAIGP